MLLLDLLGVKRVEHDIIYRQASVQAQQHKAFIDILILIFALFVRHCVLVIALFVILRLKYRAYA